MYRLIQKKSLSIIQKCVGVSISAETLPSACIYQGSFVVVQFHINSFFRGDTKQSGRRAYSGAAKLQSGIIKCANWHCKRMFSSVMEKI